MYICLHMYIFPGDSDGKESACNVGDPGWICIYMQKKNTISKQKSQKHWQEGPEHATSAAWLCFLIVIKAPPAAGPYRSLGLPASLPRFSASHTSVGLSSEPQKIFYTCWLQCSLLKTLKWPSICFSWSQKWQPTPVLLPGKFHRQRSMVGYRPRGCKGSDITEWLNTHIVKLLPVGFKTFSRAILLHVTFSFSPSCSFCGSQNHHHQAIFVTFFLSSELGRKSCKLCPPDFSHSFHHSSDSLFQKTSATYWCFVIIWLDFVGLMKVRNSLGNCPETHQTQTM